MGDEEVGDAVEVGLAVFGGGFGGVAEDAVGGDGVDALLVDLVEDGFEGAHEADFLAIAVDGVWFEGEHDRGFQFAGVGAGFVAGDAEASGDLAGGIHQAEEVGVGDEVDGGVAGAETGEFVDRAGRSCRRGRRRGGCG